MIDMVQDNTGQSTMRVRIKENLTDEFAVITGLKRGDVRRTHVIQPSRRVHHQKNDSIRH